MPVDTDWERAAPDYAHIPPLDLLTVVPAGTPLLRIYDHVAAERGQYGADSFNPTGVGLDLADVRGRWDSTPALRFGVLYVADGSLDERVVVLETVDHRGLAPDRSGRMRMLTRADVQRLSLVRLEIAADLALVDFTSRPACSDFHADQDVLEGTDHRATRAWSRYLRTVVPGADGILYRSHAYGSERSGYPMVLTGPDGAFAPQKVRRVGDDVELASAEGFDLLARLSEHTRLLPSLPW